MVFSPLATTYNVRLNLIISGEKPTLDILNARYTLVYLVDPSTRSFGANNRFFYDSFRNVLEILEHDKFFRLEFQIQRQILGSNNSSFCDKILVHQQTMGIGIQLILVGHALHHAFPSSNKLPKKSR